MFEDNMRKSFVDENGFLCKVTGYVIFYKYEDYSDGFLENSVTVTELKNWKDAVIEKWQKRGYNSGRKSSIELVSYEELVEVEKLETRGRKPLDPAEKKIELRGIYLKNKFVEGREEELKKKIIEMIENGEI